MRSKRLLTMLLAVAMIVSVLSPAAYAVKPGKNTAVHNNTAENVGTNASESSPISSGLVVSADGQTAGQNTLRDDPIQRPAVQDDQTVSGNGFWSAVETDSNLDLPMAQLPECIAELKKAAEVYGEEELVAAFVVMEDAPLSERFSSISRTTLADEQKLLAVQNRIINQIEKKVLGGADLQVRYQFTYLTNSFTIETQFRNLERIAMMDGVKSVFIMPIYHPCTTDGTATPNTAPSSQMTGVAQVWKDLGYTGVGMKIAVIDTGLDLDHPSFAADPVLTDDSMTVADIDAVLQNLNAYARRDIITAETLYRSAKVPFAFNYCDSNLTADHSADMQGDHGTHVAGIAAANPTEGTTVVGMAPDAQIIVMKVFGVNGGAYTDDIVAALEDAMTLGCDVVNGSLGSPAGFSSTDTEIDLIFERLDAQDIVACFSAGNEGTSSYGNLWGTDANRTQNPDNSTVGQPGTYANIMTVASADNCILMADFFTLADGTQIFYTDSMEAIYADAGYEDYWGAVSLRTLAGMELEYVFVDGLGTYENFWDADGYSLVEGKVAVIQRGELTFSEKVFNAQAAGAVAAIIWDPNYEDVYNFGMTTSNEWGEFPYIPSAIVNTDAATAMMAVESKTIMVSAEQGPREDSNGGQMSSFSSWGVTPDLRLEPDITGIGGNVYSCYDGGLYGLMSGTSMSSPQVAGITALVMQYVYTVYPNAEVGFVRDVVEALLMSTADPVISNISGVEASPRQQGAGLVDAFEAVTAQAYLTVNGEKPKVSMGDSDTGSFRFAFEIHNFSDADKTYTLNSSLLSEAVVEGYVTETEAEFFMAGVDMALTGTVAFSKDVVTVPAGGEAVVEVTITLSEEDKAYFAQCWENGGYVEGYVYLINEEGAVALNLPFLGFYGDWTQAPVFDTAYWYDNSFWSEYTEIPEGDEYWHVLWTSIEGSDWVPGINPYSGYVLGEDGRIVYDPSLNVLSPNGDGAMDGFVEIYLSLLRSARSLTLTYTVDNQVMHTETITHNSKTMYQSSYAQVVPWLYSWYGTAGFYNFTDAQGYPLPSGTKVKLTVDATVDYAQGGDHTLEFELVMDTVAPELVSISQMEQDGSYYLIVEAKDDTALAAAFLTNPSGTQIYSTIFDYMMEPTEAGTYLATFDVTGLGTDFQIALGDYGVNEAFFNASYQSDSDNLPEVDTTQLYAYRVFDSVIYSDSMYGWVSMRKPAADDWNSYVNTLTDDSLEYAAINAAEYAAGKIFAIDAVGNLLVLDPGLFNRTMVCNLGINALDMTFDDSTDTMYVLSNEEDLVYLYALDLSSGKLTVLAEYGYYASSPWAIADDDNGTIYAIQNSMSGIFTLDTANGYAMNPVMTEVDGVQTEVQIYNSYGEPVSPSYAQSMTYADGNLYWAYYTSGWMGDGSELITINTADWTSYSVSYVSQYYDLDNNLIDEYPITELVGLMTLTETEYTLPEATVLNGLAVDQDFLTLMVGETVSLSAVPNPWYYELGETAWTSSDESVVVVENGLITAVGEGSAQVTVTADGMSASCNVTVVEIDGNFYAYNFYSGDGYYGYRIDVDLGTMNYALLEASPVDFLAADYNGHDGCYYGYTDGGQFWRYDLSTGDIVELGTPAGTTPTDMAYDYTTGLMYATTVDYNTGASTLNLVDLNSGKLEVLHESYMYSYMTLACDDMGRLYAITADGSLITFERSYDVDTGMEGWIEVPRLEGLGYLNYAQSMCWDYKNEVLLWTCPETSSVIWIDPAECYTLNLGDPSGSGMIEFVGMYTIPETIMELPYIAVESVEVADMAMLVGSTTFPKVSFAPLNATNQQIVWTSSDESVVSVNEDGSLTGEAEGAAVISGVLDDNGTVYELSFHVTVVQGADNVYGYVMTDLATYGTQYWIRMYPEYPSSPDVLSSTPYIIFAEEYVDGKVYAYGYDPNDWEANWQYFVMDANTYVIDEQIDLGEGFPYVYDMTYDHTTGTMYGLVGASESETDLYILDLQTGAATLLLKTDPMFLSLAAGPDGVLYAMERSESELDEFGFETGVYTDANLYTIDPATLAVTAVGATGIKSNMMSSMAYDYDTDRLYWTPFLSGMTYVSSLAIVDPQTGAAMSVGSVGAMGAQISGLYIVSDSYPETDVSKLQNLILKHEKALLTVGETVQMEAITIPASVDADIRWKSSNESIATVDEHGVVTAVSRGKAVVTATVNHNGVTKTAKCTVAVLEADASFLTWNVTDGTWAAINRADTGIVTNLTEPASEINVVALAAVGADVYGYDENNQLFQLNTETYERVAIGDGLGLEVDTDNGYTFTVRDMAYDSANKRMLVLGETMLWDPDWAEYVSIYEGCAIYVLDLTTGALEHLFTFVDTSDMKALAVDQNGMVYSYSTFNDVVYQVNLDTFTCAGLVSLQTQSLYGDYASRFAMYYDNLSGCLYLLFTGNGSVYKIHTVDTATGVLTRGDYVGEVVEDEWTAYGDLFRGLVYVDENGHVCEYLNGVCQICGEKEDLDLGDLENPFTDVKESDYSFEPIMWGVHYGITSGMSASTFAPNNTCTRAQMVTFIWRTAGCPAPVSENNPFTDVNETDYFYQAVLWAVENGITAGTSATAFSPNANCTRAQAVTFLYRWKGSQTSETENRFTDVAEGQYYYDAVAWAVENGITAGMTPTTFNPDGHCTRGQIMTFLYRLWFA